MQKTFLSRVGNNVKILGLAIVLSLVLFVIVKNPQRFQASVLNLQEQKIIEQKDRDFAYKTTSWVLDMFLGTKVSNVKSVKISIDYDINAIQLLTWSIISSWDYIVQMLNTWEINISVQNRSGRDSLQSFVILPYTWLVNALLVSEALAQLQDGTTQNLAIGNLTEAMENVH